MATQGCAQLGGCARLPIERKPDSGTGVCARGVPAGSFAIDSARNGAAWSGSRNEGAGSAALSVPASISGARG